MRNGECGIARAAVGGILLFSTLTGHSLGAARPCIEPLQQQQEMVALYAAGKLHIALSRDLSVIESNQANSSCYWKYVFQDPQGKTIEVYVSPDRNYLSTELFDIRVGPQIQEKDEAQATMVALLAGNPPEIGPKDAPVTIVEFSDFECPYCQRLKTILERDVLPKEEGKMRLVFRNFPLEFHGWARSAALLTECAQQQGSVRFWKIHNFIFENQKNLSLETLRQRVEDFVSSYTDLDGPRFKKCVDGNQASGILTKDIELGRQYGVHGTPTVFINGIRYEGLQSAAQLIAIIDAEDSESNGSVAATPISNTAIP